MNSTKKGQFYLIGNDIKNNNSKDDDIIVKKVKGYIDYNNSIGYCKIEDSLWISVDITTGCLILNSDKRKKCIENTEKIINNVKNKRLLNIEYKKIQKYFALTLLVKKYPIDDIKEIFKNEKILFN